MFNKRGNRFDTVCSGFVGLLFLAFRRCDTDYFEAIACVFKAFVLLTGQCPERHDAANAAAPRPIGWGIADLVRYLISVWIWGKTFRVGIF